jgi:hypothetical protein
MLSPTTDRTYDIALAILFLDRLGDPEDELLIESLGLRLMDGQAQDNGWSYNCPALDPNNQKRLQAHYEQLQKAGPRKLPEQPPANPVPRHPKFVHPNIMNQAIAVNQRKFMQKGYIEGSDHSNTQFAMLALWVARRHGMPVDMALKRVEWRFRAYQNAKNGGWGYHGALNPADQAANPNCQPTAAMTCCGLIGLALGNAVTPPNQAKDLSTDPQVVKALFVVIANLGDTGLTRDKLALGSGGKTYYYLWTLERMAVIYNFGKIGGKDWYRWGAEVLLANQMEDGSWNGEHQGVVDTCFALLFLKKANVAADLTKDFVKKPVKAPDDVPLDLLKGIITDVKPGVDKMPKKNNPPNSPNQQSRLVPPVPQLHGRVFPATTALAAAGCRRAATPFGILPAVATFPGVG